MNKEQNILTIDELWGTRMEIEYYRDLGMPDELISKYNLIKTTLSTTNFVLLCEDHNYMQLNDWVYKIPRDIKLDESIEYRGIKKIPYVNGELKTVEEVCNKILEVFPDADVHKLITLKNPEQ